MRHQDGEVVEGARRAWPKEEVEDTGKRGQQQSLEKKKEKEI